MRGAVFFAPVHRYCGPMQMRVVLFLLVAAAIVAALILGPPARMAESTLAPLGRWLLGIQAEFQRAMALHLRGVNAGQMAAFWALMGTCFAYGFVHAAGPGHGKALIGAYAMAREVPPLRLAAIGLASALAQGMVAIALVLVLAGLAGMGRRGIEAFDRGPMQMLGLAAMALLGLWLIWRALERLMPRRANPCPPSPAMAHTGRPTAVQGPAAAMLAGAAPRARIVADATACPDCGQAHLPSPAAVMRATNLREAAALVAAVAIRPCSGALILLLLTWQMGLLWLGVLGTLAMALGTAMLSVTLALALMAGRNGMLRMVRPFSGGAQVAAGLEALAGLVLVIGALAVAVALG